MAYSTYGLSIFLVFQVYIDTSQGGICWNKKAENDRCQGPFRVNVTMEECCLKSMDSTSWTPHETFTSGDIFYWRDLNGGAPLCKRCHSNCDNVICENNKKCRMKNGVPKCVCRPTCTKRMRRKKIFCGSDRRKYKSKCHLLRKNCQLNKNVVSAYRGPCKRSCKTVKCMLGKTCVEDQNGMPHCVFCRKTCPVNTERRILCGEDGNTYQNICELRNTMCSKGGSIRIAYSGNCRANVTCADIRCPTDFKCMANPTTRRPQCVHCSNRSCSSLSKYRVCGTDGVTYKNYCKLKEKSCKMGIVIHTKHSGSCKKKGKPCKRCKKNRKKKRMHKRNRNKNEAYLRITNKINIKGHDEKKKNETTTHRNIL